MADTHTPSSKRVDGGLRGQLAVPAGSIDLYASLVEWTAALCSKAGLAGDRHICVDLA